MSRSEIKRKTWLWSPSIFVYDAGACTKEEHDPARAVLYSRPRNAPLNAQVAICGQLAGVIHFCRTSFATPTFVRTKFGHVALKHYSRFVLMVCGCTREWADSRLKIVSSLFDASTGGISALWMENHQNTELFVQKLSSLMDAIVFHALPDVNFEDGIFSSSSASTSLSSIYSPSSEAPESLDSEKTTTKDDDTISVISSLWRRSKSQEIEKSDALSIRGDQPLPKNGSQIKELPDDGILLASLHRDLDAVPSVSLPKSGASSFLRAQQLLEACQQFPGVLAGSTSFQNRVLNTQFEAELQNVLTSINDVDSEVTDILQKKKPPFQLPKDVNIYNLNVTQRALSDIVKSIPKISSKRGDRKGLRSDLQTSDLSTLRSALQNQSLHSYPSSILQPGNKPKSSFVDSSMSSSETGAYTGAMDPLLLCSKISRNGDLLADGRPSRSLPGSPRKIRVATMLPEVGSDSPELRYKVLTARRPKPGTSTHNTPRRAPGVRSGSFGKNIEGQSNGALIRGNNLTAPSLKRKEFLLRPDQKLTSNGSSILDPESQMDKENINSLCQKQFGVNNEINIKNTKNKLNLHFAPDKVNRPSDDYEDEGKIAREINGNLSKDNLSKESLSSGKFSLKSQLIDLHGDDDDESRSEDSEISVLELNSYVESKENGNRMFEEANRVSPQSGDLTESNGDSVFQGWAEAEMQGIPNVVTNSVDHQWTKVSLYIQKTSKMTLSLILDNISATNQMLIYNIYRLVSSALSEIESSVIRTLEISEEKEGDTFLQKSSSVLTVVDLQSLNSHLIGAAHQSFSKYLDITEITLRDDKTVLWSHQNCHTETYYQSPGTYRPGLPIPSDVMARIPHRARRRLERDHGITVL